MTGTRIMMTQAPWVNLVTRDHDGDHAGGDGAEAVDEQARAASPAPCAVMWCLAMPACDSVKRGEHADGVERDQRGSRRPGR